MKRERKNNKMKTIKISTIVLAIVLICMIGFFGIYVQKQNRVENAVKDYKYAMDLNGGRIITLDVNTESKEVVKDSEGKTVENATDEEISEKGYTKENVLNNSEEILTAENYNKTKQIIEKRLKSLGVENYEIKLNETTGKIEIKVDENTKTDEIVSNISTTGKFEIVDSDTEEVLMDNGDIANATVLYGQTSSTSNAVSVYLNIEFNKAGKEKLQNISNTYVKTEDSTENTTEENTTTEDTTTDSTDTSKKITMKIDGEEIMTTSFDEPITTGKLQLTVGSSSTDKITLNENVSKAQNIATTLEFGNLPVKYDTTGNEYVLSDIEEQQLTIVKIVLVVITVLAAILLIIKYKSKGLLAAISFVGFAAVYLLTIRYTNVVISIESIFGIGLILILNYIFTNILLKTLKEKTISKTIGETYKQFFLTIIPVCIMTIAFCFIKWVPISSFGMIMFWGIVLIALYNVIVTRTLLKIKTEE